MVKIVAASALLAGAIFLGFADHYHMQLTHDFMFGEIIGLGVYVFLDAVLF